MIVIINVAYQNQIVQKKSAVDDGMSVKWHVSVCNIVRKPQTGRQTDRMTEGFGGKIKRSIV